MFSPITQNQNYISLYLQSVGCFAVCYKEGQTHDLEIHTAFKDGSMEEDFMYLNDCCEEWHEALTDADKLQIDALSKFVTGYF
jgi:hypothetical protein